MKILVLEDDKNLCAAIQKELEKNGYLVDCCGDGETAMLYALNREYAYDLAIIDRMVPIIDGLTILKAMRGKGIQIPVILITGMSALEDRVEGLDGGADDYLVKPFHMEELLARTRALIRRPGEIQKQDVLRYGDLTLDKWERSLATPEKSLALTGKEAELLSVLMRQPDTLFSRERLVLKIWGSFSEVESGNVDNYVSFLRKRLRELNSVCQIKTVYGAGYKLVATHAQ